MLPGSSFHPQPYCMLCRFSCSVCFISLCLYLADSSSCPRCSRVGPDATKDPCLKVRCPPHKVCVSHDYQTAICTNHKQPAHRYKTQELPLNVVYKWRGKAAQFALMQDSCNMKLLLRLCDITMQSWSSIWWRQVIPMRPSRNIKQNRIVCFVH